MLMVEEDQDDGGESRFLRESRGRRDFRARHAAEENEGEDFEDEDEDESLEAVTRGTCGGLKRLLLQIDRRWVFLPLPLKQRTIYLYVNMHTYVHTYIH